MHINPDHFLETPTGRVWTRDGNAEAWRRSYAALHDALHERAVLGVVYVMVGCQGSGKSTWAQAKSSEDPNAIIFDAILVRKAERRPILDAAAQRRVPAVAVWFQTPLQVCVDRNARRPPDEIANEEGLRNVFAALEPPELSEGFVEIVVVRPSDT